MRGLSIIFGIPIIGMMICAFLFSCGLFTVLFVTDGKARELSKAWMTIWIAIGVVLSLGGVGYFVGAIIMTAALTGIPGLIVGILLCVVGFLLGMKLVKAVYQAPLRKRMKQNSLLKKAIKAVRSAKANYVILCYDGIRIVRDTKQPEFPAIGDVPCRFESEFKTFSKPLTSYRSVTGAEAFEDIDFAENGYQRMDDERMEIAVKIIRNELHGYRITSKKAYKSYKHPDVSYIAGGSYTLVNGQPVGTGAHTAVEEGRTDRKLIDSYYILSRDRLTNKQKGTSKKIESSSLRTW
ncbi:MAG: hypothetical protein LUH36_06575 [Oscillospiraceae bacterium]|nr:hypothetical protein [Oscillospiraceae bacterium]